MHAIPEKENKEWRPIRAAPASMRMTNPIRATIDTIKMPTTDKEIIKLSIGDPTVFANMVIHPFVKEQIHKAVDSVEFKYHGYVHSSGSAEAKKAVADRFSTERSPLRPEDVILTSGCSGALMIALTALASPGDNILLPRPGFSLYQTLCEHNGIEFRHYNLLPDNSWEIDLEHLSSLVDSRTRCILVNNPSNPCGSVWSRQHVSDILKTASRLQLPIVSDEVYFDMVFPSSGKQFYSFGAESEDVPVIVVGGIAKRFLAPGWRLGWIQIHDRNNLLKEVKEGMYRLTQLILGPNTLVQGILPEILHNTPTEFFDSTMRQLEEHAAFLKEKIDAMPGLQVIQPHGAMYAMVKIETDKFKDIENDVDFTQKLLLEESVFVLPGTIFKAPNFVRLVICPAIDKLQIATDRMAAFCRAHAKETIEGWLI
jgi:tyrosine aminotransferase